MPFVYGIYRYMYTYTINYNKIIGRYYEDNHNLIVTAVFEQLKTNIGSKRNETQ